MAGHSHSANIAHRKGLVDAKRAKLFTKLVPRGLRGARIGGGDPAANMRLRYSIDKARSFSVPKDNIERSIKKATGELGGENFEEVVYEGYGPGGVAVLCEALTDNRNRTASELRRLFELAGGNLGAMGCVGYLFTFKGLFVDRSQACHRGTPDGGRLSKPAPTTSSWSTVITRSPATPSCSRPCANRSRKSGFPPKPPRPATSRVTIGRPRCRQRPEDAASSGICSTKTTTSRTSTPTTISPRKRWRPERCDDIRDIVDHGCSH